jgi:hypothetical protein
MGQMLNTAGDQRLPVAVTGQPQPCHNRTNSMCESSNVPITVFATTHGSGSSAGAKGLQLFASNFYPEKGATKFPRMPNTTTVSVTIKNLPASVKTAQLYRIDDNVTNPYETWVGWDSAAQAAGMCNSHCKTADSTGSATACPCLMYLTPMQIDELNAVRPTQ